MEKGIFVKDIGNNQEVNDYFLVVKKSVNLSKNSTRYISLILRDSSGTIEGRIWERVDELESRFERDDIVYLNSRSTLYQEKLQLNITDIKKVEEKLTIEDLKIFLPEGEAGIQSLIDEYYGLVGEIRNESLKRLFERLHGMKGIMEKFFFFPASINVHHVFIGGLLQHSVSMAKMGREIVNVLGGSKDLVVAGCLLHDIGKVEEFEIRGGFKYSDRGRLLGHIALGIEIISELSYSVLGISDLILTALKHIILSHHGREEWGSPRKPMFIEALIVHYLDNLDSKVTGVKEHMRERMVDENWTDYHRLFESRFYNLRCEEV